MERLTDKNHNAINKCGEYSSCYSCHKEICYIKELEEKLGELEDVLEKYGIESVEELEDYLTPKLFCHAKLSENLDELKKYCQCESIIHIDTCEPQIELITDKVKDLEQELAELKQKAIVPKFKIGQEVWWIDTRVNSFNEQRYRIESYLIDSIVITKEQFRYYGDDGLWLGDNELFATKEEAEQKLAEIKGE